MSTYNINHRDVLLEKTEIRETSILIEKALTKNLTNKTENFEEYLRRLESIKYFENLL